MARILVAEDDAHIMRVLCIWLKRNGHQVTEAPDGLAAQDALKADSFDLLVTDVNMPRLDGVSLVEWMREEAGSAVPVIMMTSRCDQKVLAGKMAHWNVVLHPKPFSPSRLASVIEMQLRQSAAADKAAGCDSMPGSQGTGSKGDRRMTSQNREVDSSLGSGGVG